MLFITRPDTGLSSCLHACFHPYRCRHRDASAEAVLLEVRASNQAALQLYHSFGFEEVGLRRGYYQVHLSLRGGTLKAYFLSQCISPCVYPYAPLQYRLCTHPLREHRVQLQDGEDAVLMTLRLPAAVPAPPSPQQQWEPAAGSKTDESS